MNEWCIETHGKSGLTDKILANPDRKLLLSKMNYWSI